MNAPDNPSDGQIVIATAPVSITIHKDNYSSFTSLREAARKKLIDKPLVDDANYNSSDSNFNDPLSNKITLEFTVTCSRAIMPGETKDIILTSMEDNLTSKSIKIHKNEASIESSEPL